MNTIRKITAEKQRSVVNIARAYNELVASAYEYKIRTK